MHPSRGPWGLCPYSRGSRIGLAVLVDSEHASRTAVVSASGWLRVGMPADGRGGVRRVYDELVLYPKNHHDNVNVPAETAKKMSAVSMRSRDDRTSVTPS